MEQIAAAIAAKAEGEEKAIIEAARVQARQFEQQANEAGKAGVARAIREAQALSLDEQRKVSSARLRGRKIIAEARERIVMQAIARLEEGLQEISQSKRGELRGAYGKLLLQLAQTAAAEIGEGAQLYCRAEDEHIVSQAGRVKGHMQPAGVLATTKDGMVRSDYTFEAIVRHNEDRLKQKAFKMIFGGGGVQFRPAALKKRRPARKAGKKARGRKR